MRRFLIRLDLETDVNIVKYIYPQWLTDEMKKKIQNLSSTTPADTFVDVVVSTDVEEECETILANGGKELTDDQYASWVEAKILILQLIAQQEETDELTI